MPAKGAREPAGKGAPASGPGKERTKWVPATEPPKAGWALTLEGLAAMRSTQRRHHLLFGDLLEDVGMAASIFPRESVELEYGMPDTRAWTQRLELPAERQNRLLGVLKAAEARGRVRALRLRYTRMRAEEIALLIQRQSSARAAIRLELLLPPLLRPTRIPDPLDRQEVRAGPEGEGPHAPHTGPSPSSRSGGAWRPSWRRPWMATSPGVDGACPCPPSYIKIFSEGSLVFPLAFPWTLRARAESGRAVTHGGTEVGAPSPVRRLGSVGAQVTGGIPAHPLRCRCPGDRGRIPAPRQACAPSTNSPRSQGGIHEGGGSPQGAVVQEQ